MMFKEYGSCDALLLCEEEMLAIAAAEPMGDISMAHLHPLIHAPQPTPAKPAESAAPKDTSNKWVTQPAPPKTTPPTVSDQNAFQSKTGPALNPQIYHRPHSIEPLQVPRAVPIR